jgi:dihydroorotate dehydrogenase electron transfer subunit
MSKSAEKLTKGRFTASVYKIQQVGPTFWCLGIEFSKEGAKAFASAKPGQFLEIDASHAALPASENIPPTLADAAQRSVLLRRPFSFSDITSENGKTRVDILFCVVGPATLRMTQFAAGDEVSVLGPLGNGFWVPDGKKSAILVAGGMGAPPLQHLARILAKDHAKMNVIALAGAKTKEELAFDIEKLKGANVQAVVSTDDGSHGYQGYVTDLLTKQLEKGITPEETIIYSCGPEPMLEIVAKKAEEHNIDCQVSLERRMACGIGLCQSCAVECKCDDGSSKYKMCCNDGPVFDAKEVIFTEHLGC